jgi:8-amino-7-oxononanoate synthase
MAAMVMTRHSLIDRVRENSRLTAMRELQEQSSLPYFHRIESPVDALTVVDGREVIMFGSNNYLALGNHPRVVSAANAATSDLGAAMLGSRLYTGTTGLHLQLEQEIAEWHHTESAIVFTTGYQTSIGSICGLLGVGDSIVVDSAIHTSIRDAGKLSGANIRTFQHNQLDSLRAQLERLKDRDGMTLVVIESIYSMEGDVAPLTQVADLCREYGAALMLDEAHSVGLLGAERTGLAELCGVTDQVTIRMGTFSKALASTGGFIAGPRDLVDALRLNATAFVFSMAAIPASVGAAIAAIQIVRSDEGAELAGQVLRNADTLRSLLSDRAVPAGGASAANGAAGGPIVSVPIGQELAAVAVWCRLLDNGVFTGLSMFPAVPQGHAILRMSTMASHSPEMLQTAADAVASALKSSA